MSALTDERIDEFAQAELGLVSEAGGSAGGGWFVDGAHLNKADVRIFARAIEAEVVPVGWISVNDRLPDEDMPVFALYPNGHIHFRTRSYDSDGWYWCNPYGRVRHICGSRWESDAEFDDDYAGVTHWQAMPAAPVS